MVLSGGTVIARYHKHHLPNYGVFDEYRYFGSRAEPCVEGRRNDDRRRDLRGPGRKAAR